MADLKNRKVLNVRTHVGGLHGKTSYDAVKDKVDMEITPVGILIEGKGPSILVPWPNCTEVIVSDAVPDALPDDAKRGPGRPPGPRAA